MADPTAQNTNVSEILQTGRETLATEAAAILAVRDALGEPFEQAVQAILTCDGRLVVSGVGKSGHIGKKLAASFASTGTPAFFVHAGEAGHGDLGMVTPSDVLLVISHSGESDEVVNLAHLARRNGTQIIAMVGKLESSLAKAAHTVLHCFIEREACPLGVAPTASTAVQLAMGDALAMATMKARGFTQEDFGRTHPFGALGRRLYLRVQDVMQPLDKVPHLPANTPLLEAVSEMAASRIGAVVALNGDKLAGIFTDADLRRLLVKTKDNLASLAGLTLDQVASRTPLAMDVNALASQALVVFEKRHVSRLVCLEDGKPKGLLSLFDLLDHKVA